jgi:hypothetical protein
VTHSAIELAFGSTQPLDTWKVPPGRCQACASNSLSLTHVHFLQYRSFSHVKITQTREENGKERKVASEKGWAQMGALCGKESPMQELDPADGPTVPREKSKRMSSHQLEWEEVMSDADISQMVSAGGRVRSALNKVRSITSRPDPLASATSDGSRKTPRKRSRKTREDRVSGVSDPEMPEDHARRHRPTSAMCPHAQTVADCSPSILAGCLHAARQEEGLRAVQHSIRVLMPIMHYHAMHRGHRQCSCNRWLARQEVLGKVQGTGWSHGSDLDPPP